MEQVPTQEQEKDTSSLDDKTQSPSDLAQTVGAETGTQTTEVIEPKKRIKRLTVIVSISLLIIAIGTGVYFLTIKKNTKNNSDARSLSTSNSDSAEPSLTTKKINSLIYAYKEGKKVTVRTIKLADKTKSDLFSYDEERETNKIDFNYGISQPNVDRNSSGVFVYAADNGIYIGKNGAIEQKVKRTVLSDGNQASFTPEFEIALPKEGPGSPYLVYNPRWVADNKSIAFATGYYEGGGVAQYVLSTNKLSVISNTFIYIMQSYDGSTSLKITGSALLPELNYGETYYFKRNGVLADFVPGGASAAAVLCRPVASADEFSDCTKYPHKLASIDTKSGAITVLGEGSYDSVTAAAADLWYVMSRSGGVKAISQFIPSTKVMTNIDLSAALMGQGEILYARIIPSSPTLAEVYSKKSSGYAVTVVSLEDQKLVATFDIAEASAFKVLGAE